MGKRGKIDYFTSLIFRNSFSYYNVHVKDSFDLSLGATYNFSKDLSLSIKGENLLEKSTSSIYTVGFPGTPFALENKTERSVSLWLRWMF
jgi:iron complex outermembrane receptor protein